MRYWANRCVFTGRVLFGADDLPEGLPPFRFELDPVSSGEQTADKRSHIKPAFDAFYAHVRDGTARGQRVWQVIEQDHEALRGWLRQVAQLVYGAPPPPQPTGFRRLLRHLRIRGV